ncbi:hypothetical protein V8C40DRAFT_228845 [Trichoderma camerunense]
MLPVISLVGAGCKGDPTKIVIRDIGTGTSVMTADCHMLLLASPRALPIRCCSCYDAWLVPIGCCTVGYYRVTPILAALPIF